jgi:hypothetical protein
MNSFLQEEKTKNENLIFKEEYNILLNKYNDLIKENEKLVTYCDTLETVFQNFSQQQYSNKKR